MGDSQGFVKILLFSLTVYFFAKQFILYKRFKARGVYDKPSMTLAKEVYYLRKGFREAKKEFMND